MKKKLFILAAAFSVLACQPSVTPVKVMTFNVRAGVANDHENSWQYRRKAAADMILDQRPAVWISSWSISWSNARCISAWVWAVRTA